MPIPIELITGRQINADILADPAAGQPVNAPLTHNNIARIMEVIFTLTTGAGVANRVVYISTTGYGSIPMLACSPFVQTAAQSITYIAAPGLGTGGVNALAAKQQFSLSPFMHHISPGNILITADNLQAADQFSTIVVYYHIEPVA